MIARHFNLSASYIATRLPWAEWVTKLYLALEQEERLRRRSYMGKPEEYEPAFVLPGDDKAAEDRRMSGDQVVEKVLAFAQSRGIVPTKTSLKHMSEWRPDLVRRVIQHPDGTFTDEAGNPVDVGSRHFVPAEEGDEDAPALAPFIPGLPPEIAAKIANKG